jgi:cation diffusion facilitator family transporter
MSKRRLAAATILGGIIIFLIKIYSYIISDSVALLSDALESIVNILASLMMFTSVIISEQPPDEEHKYGHQKIENISCFIEGSLVLLAGALIARTALTRIIDPVEPVRLNLAILISLVATLMNGVLSWLLMNKAKETGSLALEGDAKHLLSDVLSSGGVAAGLFVGKIFNYPLIDPIMALIVAALVLRLGLGLLWKSGTGLMDISCPETEDKLRRLLDRHQNQFIDYHNLKTRRSGDRVFAELHLSMDGGMSVEEAHDFTEHLEEDIKQEMPELNLTIHIEPSKEKDLNASTLL